MATPPPGDTGSPPHDPLLDRLRLATRGSYDVTGELGRGGMAAVYVGVDRKLQRRVAIKVMDPRLSMTPGMAERFLQEARIAARLQHPNIIVVHDVRQNDEIIFFVMSLIDGVAVDDLVRHAQPIPIDQIRWILFQAARALAYAHSEEIVHRDIKPANILLNLKGEVILTDFGIAKALGDTGLTQSGMSIGTPTYMSPEQFSGVPVGPPSDQYALGVTAYQLITGVTPFTGDVFQLIAAHGTTPPVPIRERRPDCPPFLANAVMRMLAKNAEDRWPSLDDVQEVLGANMAMDGGPARRKLSETVRALHRGAPAASLPSDGFARTPPSAEHAPTSVVVTISPPGATIFVAGTLDLRASVNLDTGESLPGAGVRWTSSDETVLRVQANGTVTGMAPGTAVVRALVNGATSEAMIRVEAAPIARLSLSSPNLTLRVGDVIRPEVVAVDVNGAPSDGVAMSWISRTPAVADLDAPGVIRAISPGVAVVDVSAGNVRRSLDVVVLRRPVARLALTADRRTLQPGDTVALRVEAFDDVGAPADATGARWSSSAPSVIHVDSTGRALAIDAGVARISVSLDDATDTLDLEALEPPVGSVQFAQAEQQVELGDEVTWTLRVKDESGASRSAAGVRVWSSDPEVVLVDDGGARAYALRLGEATLHAAPEGASPELTAATMRVVVTDVVVARLEVMPGSLDLEVGAVAAVTAQSVDRRGTPVVSQPLVWQVDAPDVAAVEGQGVVRALAPGSCSLRVSTTNSDGTTAHATVAVRVRRASVARLSIAAERSMLEVGEHMVLRATTWDARDVEVPDAVLSWRSTQPDIARVDGHGVVFALAPGRVTITAELDGKRGQLSVLVAPSAITSLSIAPVTGELVVGQRMSLTVLAVDRNGQPVTPEVRWEVDPPAAARITAAGEVTALGTEPFTVRAVPAAPTDTTGLLAPRSALHATLALQARAAVPVRQRVPKPVWAAFGVAGLAAVAWGVWPAGPSGSAGAPLADSSGPMAPRTTPGTSPNAGDAPPLATARGASDTVRPTAEALAAAPPATSQRPTGIRGEATGRPSGAPPPTVAGPKPGPAPAPTPVSPPAGGARTSPADSAPARATTPPPSATVAAEPATEAPSAADLRAIAARLASSVANGSTPGSPELMRFFADGAEHKASVGTPPTGSPGPDGHVRTQFELALTRYNAGGARESRVTVVRIHVVKRGGVAELVSAEFGPLTKPGGRSPR